MLGKIVLARNTHAGREQAERLEHLISTADVISFEMATASRDDASETENLFNSYLLLFKAREYLQKLVGNGDEGADYEYALHELIESYQKPVVLIEKLHPIDSKNAKRLKRLSELAAVNSLKLFYQGQVKRAIELRINSNQFLQQSKELRDKRIIQYASRAFSEAQQKVKKEDISYLVVLGGQHTIARQLSKSTGVPVEDVFFPATAYSHYKPGPPLSLRVERTSAEHQQKMGQLIVFNILPAGLFNESLLRFSLEVIPPAYRQAPYNVVLCVHRYAVKPISSHIAQQLSMKDIEAYSHLLKRRRCTADNVNLLKQVTNEFLIAQGLNLPQSLDEFEKWRVLFPFGKEQSTEPVVTTYASSD